METKKIKKKYPRKFTLFIILLFIILVPLTVYKIRRNSSSDSSPQYSTKPDFHSTIKAKSESEIKAEIITMVREKVKQKLRNPLTADFPGIWKSADQIQKINYNQYQFKSYVDSKNDFGVLKRVYFVAIIDVDNGDVSINDIKYYLNP